MRLWWQVPRVLAILPPACHEVGQRQFSEVVGEFFVGVYFFFLLFEEKKNMYTYVWIYTYK